ncbi:MAG TPA: DUF4136 domain-containing protein [Cyclobacteriaceae bacterium]|mgnify:CR=1 FL=1|nr:DUF4136 domain-containing protein [Cyclobacteriaceae bacterium]HOO09841.1 DUF4136 domain-containing protein [Cyclobacteriaceae bacterium]HPI79392.1 DUF4136 domain-containing protein [Cyclobacteriaceae bacterium]
MRPLIILIGLGCIVNGCQPVPDAEELNQDLVVQTDYDGSVDFGAYATYTLALDTLGLISNSTSDTLQLGKYAVDVTTRIKANMDARGYTFVDKNQNPDLGVVAFIVSDFSVYQTISYPGYGGGYYSPYYGYYYPRVNTYASNSAALILQLVDLNKKTAQNQFKLIWACYIGDIASSIDPFQKSVEAVDQAFVQSPTIGK